MGLEHHRTPEITLRISCLHIERIYFLVLKDATMDIVLGYPWLAKHHPDIHGTSGEVIKWRDSCLRE